MWQVISRMRNVWFYPSGNARNGLLRGSRYRAQRRNLSQICPNYRPTSVPSAESVAVWASARAPAAVLSSSATVDGHTVVCGASDALHGGRTRAPVRLGLRGERSLPQRCARSWAQVCADQRSLSRGRATSIHSSPVAGVCVSRHQARCASSRAPLARRSREPALRPFYCPRRPLTVSSVGLMFSRLGARPLGHEDPSPPSSPGGDSRQSSRSPQRLAPDWSCAY